MFLHLHTVCVCVYIINENMHTLTDVPLLDFGKQLQPDFGVRVLLSLAIC